MKNHHFLIFGSSSHLMLRWRPPPAGAVGAGLPSDPRGAGLSSDTSFSSTSIRHTHTRMRRQSLSRRGGSEKKSRLPSDSTIVYHSAFSVGNSRFTAAAFCQIYCARIRPCTIAEMGRRTYTGIHTCPVGVCKKKQIVSPPPIRGEVPLAS